MKKLAVISVGYARQALKQGSREYNRMLSYAVGLSELHIIVFTKKGDGFQQPLRNNNLTLHPTNSWCRPCMLIDAFIIGLSILLKRDKTKLWVISSQDPFETSAVGRILSFFTRVPHHVQLHGDNYGSPLWRKESLLNNIRYWYGLYILRSAFCIRVASERIKRSLIGLSIKGEKITVLPIRPELERFLAAPHMVRNGDSFTFLAASRFAPEKNIPLMVSAFYEISKEYSHVRLQLIGEGSEESHIRKLVTELHLNDRIEIIGWTEAIEKRMQEADVFISSSDHEAYGLTFIEAMAVGLPIVTTDVGCVGEIIQDEVHALVVPVRDRDALVRAMRRMVTDYPFRLHSSKAGKERAGQLACITQEAYAKQWVDTIICSMQGV